jgi:asparagine synthase (glutamine-hydrolysing)
MCGIAGFARLDGNQLSPGERPVLESMARALRPRGPDDLQFFWGRSAATSFTRLSLIDPIGGGQPFTTRDGLLALTANGEIYNSEELRREFPGYEFRSRSDCEVLLPLYERDGTGFLDRVRGMFAVAVVDLRKNSVVLARDRIGLKPMFAWSNGSQLVFGSEVKALFQHPACPRRLDWLGALTDQGLSAAAVMPSGAPMNWFLDIEQIEPGTIVTYDLAGGARKTRRYWSFPDPIPAGETTMDTLIEEYRELFASSVSDCLIADAEIGVMLSGGVDSAGVAALSQDVVEHAYTVVTASTIANEDAPNARATANALGLTHHEVGFPIDAHPDPDEWRRLLWLMESPLCGPEQHFKSEIYRVARFRRPDLKAMLLGSGADELGGGYTVMLAGDEGWQGFIETITDMSRRRALSGRPAALATWWNGGRRLISDEAVQATASGGMGDPYDDFMRWKIRDWQQFNCWVEDRTASGNAVEARMPFLDHRLIETLCRIPREYRPQLLWDKQIIRSALRRNLPQEVLGRPKTPFYHGIGVSYTEVAFARMLRANDYELVDQALAAPEAGRFLQGEQVRACVDDIIAGTTSTRLEVLLRLINLGLLEEMCKSVPGQPATSREMPLELAGDASEDERRQLIFGRTPVGPESVFARGPHVLVLTGATESYVAMFGELRFVIDHEDDAAWLEVLQGCDGSTPLGVLCRDIGCQIAAVEELVEQSLLLGVLTEADQVVSPST